VLALSDGFPGSALIGVFVAENVVVRQLLWLQDGVATLPGGVQLSGSNLRWTIFF